jgi:hypothetical protein
MQARHAQDDHARLPADRPGEGSEPGAGGGPPPADTAVALALEEPRGVAAPSPLAPAPPHRPRHAVAVDRGGEASSGAADPAAPVRWGNRLFENLDLVVLVPAVLVALALGAPAFGVLVGAGAWLLQRAVAVADRRLIVRAAEPGSRLGLNFIDAFARIWLLVAGIVVAGAAGSHRDGLAAALVIFAAYTIAFAVRIARGREGGPA